MYTAFGIRNIRKYYFLELDFQRLSVFVIAYAGNVARFYRNTFHFSHPLAFMYFGHLYFSKGGIYRKEIP